jgi:CheY-like chemotaxis protein
MVPVHPISGIDVQPDQRDRLIVGLAPNQPKRRILVVDDQRENRLLLVRLLTQLGLDVREATNGQEAIRTWQEWHPDLTWMDIRMPDMDGYEATQWIREYEKSREHHAEIGSARNAGLSASHTSIHPSIIIALTAQASQSDRTLALAAGCDDYISKPFHEETLFLKLKEYLGLEYLYAEADPPSDRMAAPALNSTQTDLAVLEQTMFAKLSANWLHRLEYAAVCGDDRAIVDLAAQLPSDLAPLVTHLTALADQFQFEQILTLIHTYAAH